jgi:hypothetical protein
VLVSCAAYLTEEKSCRRRNYFKPQIVAGRASPQPGYLDPSLPACGPPVSYTTPRPTPTLKAVQSCHHPPRPRNAPQSHPGYCNRCPCRSNCRRLFLRLRPELISPVDGCTLDSFHVHLRAPACLRRAVYGPTLRNTTAVRHKSRYIPLWTAMRGRVTTRTPLETWAAPAMRLDVHRELREGLPRPQHPLRGLASLAPKDLRTSGGESLRAVSPSWRPTIRVCIPHISARMRALGS